MMPRDGRNTIDAWSFCFDLRSARLPNARAKFTQPARMAEQFRTDDALFTAYQNPTRPAVLYSQVEIEAAPGARSALIADEAGRRSSGPTAIGVTAATLKSIHGCLVDHGVACSLRASVATFRARMAPASTSKCTIGFYRIRSMGSDLSGLQGTGRSKHGSAWRYPARGARHGTSYGTVGGFWIPIVHGDGRWVIFSDYEIEPFRHATLLPAALVWARHAFAARDWSRGSKNSRIGAKVIGELPSGVPAAARR